MWTDDGPVSFNNRAVTLWGIDMIIMLLDREPRPRAFIQAKRGRRFDGLIILVLTQDQIICIAAGSYPVLLAWRGSKWGFKKYIYWSIERQGKYMVDIIPRSVLWLTMAMTATLTCTGGQTVTFCGVKFDLLFKRREAWMKFVAFVTLGPQVYKNTNDSNFCLYVGLDSSPKVTNP